MLVLVLVLVLMLVGDVNNDVFAIETVGLVAPDMYDLLDGDDTDTGVDTGFDGDNGEDKREIFAFLLVLVLDFLSGVRISKLLIMFVVPVVPVV